jgi:Mrr N-terminal domain
MADDHEHTSQEIRERLRVRFDIAPHELLQKHKNRTPVFHDRVAWALAYLNMRRRPLGHSEAIEKVKSCGIWEGHPEAQFPSLND